MIIKINRWQPRTGRYQTKKHDLGEGRPILDMLVNNNGMRLTPDLAVEQMVLRTQRVDRIVMDTIAGVVEVFMSPVVDRNYKRELTDAKSKKARMSDIMCHCRHTKEQHSPGTWLCLVPGCDCRVYQEAGTRRELVDAKISQIAAEKKPLTTDEEFDKL